MSQTHTAVLNYCSALQADQYHVRLVNPDGIAIPVTYSAEQIARSETVNYLRGRNAEGFNVYARPLGWQYILLDDLCRDVLTDVAKLRPCLLLETSPANYQAWLMLPDVPPHRDEAKAICRELAQRFGADLASADPDHVGRLPGFTNRKPKYRQTNGLFPFVKLHRWAHRPADFYPGGGAMCSIIDAETDRSSATVPTVRSMTQAKTTSNQDFGVTCGLVRCGKTDDEIRQHLLNTSPNLRERKGKDERIDKYIKTTIYNARKVTVPNHVGAWQKRPKPT
ncbi:MAG: hypothetical protein H7319_15925 [Spirosoma sp.]|nr:hypothetical protein [Spirosoma sp.]